MHSDRHCYFPSYVFKDPVSCVCIVLIDAGAAGTSAKREVSHSLLHVDRLRKPPQTLPGAQSHQAGYTRGERKQTLWKRSSNYPSLHPNFIKEGSLSFTLQYTSNWQLAQKQQSTANSGQGWVNRIRAGFREAKTESADLSNAHFYLQASFMQNCQASSAWVLNNSQVPT